MKILIVDDNDVITELLSIMASRAGLQYDTALTVQGAINKLKESNYDLILLDYLLDPVTCEPILEFMVENDAPGKVIIFTNYDISEVKDSLNGTKKRVDGFLKKIDSVRERTFSEFSELMKLLVSSHKAPDFIEV